MPLTPAASASGGQLTWSQRAPLPTPRSEVASAVLDGRIYVIAGFLRRQQQRRRRGYDVAADRWQRLAPLPEPRDHAMAAAFGGKVYVFGGGARRRDSHDLRLRPGA